MAGPSQISKGSLLHGTQIDAQSVTTEHNFIISVSAASQVDNVGNVWNKSGGYSAFAFWNPEGIIGAGNYGFAVGYGTQASPYPGAYLATNPNVSTDPAHPIMIGHEQDLGSGYIAHHRLYIDPTAQTVGLYGLSVTDELGPLGLVVDDVGDVGVGAVPTRPTGYGRTVHITGTDPALALTYGGGTWLMSVDTNADLKLFSVAGGVTPIRSVYNATEGSISIGTASVNLAVPLQLPSYTVAGVPAATTAARMIYVSNETGGAVPAFSDGTNWRRVTDRAVIAA